MPSRDFVAFDPLAILNALSDVEFLVVGGFAAVLYGAPTTTGDLDILPLDEEGNIARLGNALSGLHSVVREPAGTARKIPVTVELLRATVEYQDPGGQLLTLTSAGPLDILWRLHDGRTYRDLAGGSSLLEENELRVRVIALDDLVQIKAAIGRDRDRAVLPYLEEIRRRRDRDPGHR